MFLAPEAGKTQKMTKAFEKHENCKINQKLVKFVNLNVENRSITHLKNPLTFYQTPDEVSWALALEKFKRRNFRKT